MESGKLKKISNGIGIDNSELEQLMKINSRNDEIAFFAKFKESQLIMPVIWSENMFEDIENAKEGDIFEPKGPVGFDINCLTNENGKKAIPLFTSFERMEESGLRSSANVYYMSDLADLLKGTDKYSVIVINPFTDLTLNFPFNIFLDMFSEEPKGIYQKIDDIQHERLRELLKTKDVSDSELRDELFKSNLIVPFVRRDGELAFALIWKDNQPHLPIFTDLEAFDKVFSNHKGDVFPDAYPFKDILMFAKEDLVINPGIESFEFSPDVFKEKSQS